MNLEPVLMVEKRESLSSLLVSLSVFLPESFENLATSRLFGFVKETF